MCEHSIAQLILLQMHSYAHYIFLFFVCFFFLFLFASLSQLCFIYYVQLLTGSSTSILVHVTK